MGGEYALTNPPIPAPDTLIVNDVPLVFGFKAFWEWLGDDEPRYKTLGLPLAPEFAVTTIPGVASAQAFERCFLIYQPSETWGVVVAPRSTQRLLEAL